MKSKLAIGEAVPITAKKSRAQYRVFVSCNRCGGEHEMEISVVMEDGPSDKQSISNLYDGKTLPQNLADLTNKIASPAPRQGGNPLRKTTTTSF
jgi:hypothetical protein